MISKRSAAAFAALMSLPTNVSPRWSGHVLEIAKSAGLSVDDYLCWHKQDTVRDTEFKSVKVHTYWDALPTGLRWEGMYGDEALHFIAEKYGQHSLCTEPQELWDLCDPVPVDHAYFEKRPDMRDFLTEYARAVPFGLGLRVKTLKLSGGIVVPLANSTGRITNLEFLLSDEIWAKGRHIRQIFLYEDSGLFCVGTPTSESSRIFVCGDTEAAWLCSAESGHPAISAFTTESAPRTVDEFIAPYPDIELVSVPSRGRVLQGDWIKFPETLHMFDPQFEHCTFKASRIQRGMEEIYTANEHRRIYDENKAAREQEREALAIERAAQVLEQEAHEVALEVGREGSRAYKREFEAYLEDNTPMDEMEEKPKFNLIGSSELEKLPPLAWRVAGVFPSTGIVGLYGASGSGKSFLAFDFAAAVASGTDWFGRKVEATSVVYIVLENDGGFPQRVSAWEQHNNRKMPSTLKLIMEPFNLTSDADIAALAEVIPSGSVVIIDTLNRAAPTVDENSSQGMGRILEASKSLQMQTAGLVVLVHHTGKDESRGARGHSSLYAALDAAILVSLKSGKREWSLHKAKDDRDGDAFPFSLDPVILGVSPTGDQVSSCVVSSVGQNRPNSKGQLKLSVPQRTALDALRYLIEKTGIAPTTAVVERYPGDSPKMVVAESAWKRAAIQAGISDADSDPTSKSKAFTRAKNSLLDLGLVSVFDGQVWTTCD